jgi:glycosyltransferase involved in cell wall biosynthesis
LTQSEAVNHVSQADVLAFTSVQEGTPHAVLEALSLGVPVICHDACGMGVAVNHTCGLKLPMTSPVASVNGFADALVQLISDPELLGRLSAGALRRSRDLSWEAKVKRISDVYREVAANVIC